MRGFCIAASTTHALDRMWLQVMRRGVHMWLELSTSARIGFHGGCDVHAHVGRIADSRASFFIT